MSMPNPYQQGPLHPGTAPGHLPPVPDTQPEPKKKGGCLKWGGAAVGAFVLIGIFTNIAGGDEDDPAAPATTATTTTITSSPLEASPSTRASASPEPMTPTRAATTTLPTESAEEPPETFSEAAADTGNVPADFRSALRQAGSYANDMHMSKQGVYDQLVSEYGGQFSAEAAQYAIDNVQADWNTNALESARSYQDMNMSPAAIHDQLTSPYGGQFTQAEADYAIANL